MQSASHIRRLLGQMVLVLFMVIHAPVAGVMTAAQASPDNDLSGAGMMVICLDGTFAQIEVPGEAQPNSLGGHECLCPCATLADTSAPNMRPSPYEVILQERELGRADWSTVVGPALTPAPQTGRGSPRSPPISHI